MTVTDTIFEERVISRPCGRKILYFCPSTVMGNVKREFERWAPKRSVVIIGGRTKAERQFLLSIMRKHPEYVVVCNYEAWRKDKSLIEELIDIEFDTCIIDEAHNVKDMSSIAYKGIKEIITRSEIPFVFPMTGTPILNKPQELFSLLSLVDGKTFYRLSYFLQDYCQQDPYTGKWSFRPGGLQSLSRKIRNIFMRRTKEQAGIILPPKTIQLHEIEIDEYAYPMQAKARNEMRQWASIKLDLDGDKAVSAAAAIAVYTRLRQIETYPAGIRIVNEKTGEVEVDLKAEGYDESQKIDYIIHQNGELEGLLPEIVYNRTTGEGERVVIFSQFTQPLYELQRRCEAAGIKAALLVGGVKDEVRNEIASDFDIKDTPNPADSKWDVVLCNYKVGGVGLNFTAATQMIVLDEEWNPGKRDQAYDRIHRMGQDKPVTIHVLRDYFTNGDPDQRHGIDSWLAGIIEEKEQIVEGFNSAMDIAAAGKDALKSGLL